MIGKLKKYVRERRLLSFDRSKRMESDSLLSAFDQKKAIFVHIPKTAGLSVVESVFGTHGGHRTAVYYRKVFDKEFEQYFKFTFIRNPWDRLYSAYRFLEAGGVNKHDKQAFEMHLGNCQSFEDFVMNWLDKKMIFKIIHLFPQSYFLVGNKGELLVDYVGRFESLQDDFQHIVQKLSLEITLPHVNKTKRKDSYQLAYTKGMIEKVARIYQEDISRFSYTFK
mgnify:CR=1 FL=1